MPNISAVRSYKQLDNTSRVQEKPPEELIFLMLEKACSCIRRAILLIEAGPSAEIDQRLQEVEEYGLCTSKTLQILTSLMEIINYEDSGELGTSLRETYEIIRSAAWSAFKNRSLDDLRKVLEAVSELKDAWEQIKSRNTPDSP
ncbi:MAG: flagellar export chaperone FliS [Pseudomonadota bacterium]|nr:flagellar export chaperone FliS [Pseudomonadota bacterium]